MDVKDMVIVSLGAIVVGMILDEKYFVRRKPEDSEAQAVVDTIFKNIIRNSQK